MDYDKIITIEHERGYNVVKANELVRQARYDLNKTELKLIGYIFSKVKPDDKEITPYEIEIKTFCQLCGIDYTNGYHYGNIKKCIEGLWHKGFWITDENGDEVGCQWIVKPRISKRSGKLTVKLDEDLQKYVIGLYGNFTQYELRAILPMQSTYSIRIYELLKSYAFANVHEFDIDELKKKLACEHYKNFKDFRIWVLEKATSEINKYTDIEISWEPVKHGAKVVKVKFNIREKDESERIEANWEVRDQLEGQLSLDDYYK